MELPADPELIFRVPHSIRLVAGLEKESVILFTSADQAASNSGHT
jgi:hypothetical protein